MTDQRIEFSDPWALARKPPPVVFTECAIAHIKSWAPSVEPDGMVVSIGRALRLTVKSPSGEVLQDERDTITLGAHYRAQVPADAITHVQGLDLVFSWDAPPPDGTVFIDLMGGRLIESVRFPPGT